MKKANYLSGPRIQPKPIQADLNVVDLVDNTFMAYNAARLKEACRLFTEKMLEPDVTIALSLTGALTPAGLGISALIPLIQNGYVDWIVSTGANLYHDTHFGLDFSLHKGTPFIDDKQLWEEKIVRIYDIFFDYHVLLDTDKFYREIIKMPEFRKPMSSADFHYLCGKYILEREKILGLDERGNDYFLQITDARPDTGGLSGATPNEAVSWGKVDPDRLPDSVVYYLDSTVALPILTAYALSKCKPRRPKRLIEQKNSFLDEMKKDYLKKQRKTKTG